MRGREQLRRDYSQERENNELLRCYQATLLGGAIGDTLGMPVEGWDRDQIRRHIGQITKPIDPVVVKDELGRVVHRDEIGRIPYVSPYLLQGQITDDTWLSIATARSIVDARGLDLSNLANHSLVVYQQQVARQVDVTPEGTPIAAFLHPDSEIPQAFGSTTIAAFENLKRGVSPTESGVLSRNPGNAPAIKVAPVGMHMHATGQYDDGLEFAEQVGRMTHLDPRSIVSGVVQAHAIHALLNGSSRNEFVDSIVRVAQEREKSREEGKKVTLLERLKWVADNRDAADEIAFLELGTGWAVTRNYPFTIFMFQKYWDNPVEGLLKTVNSGGDCDSTGAMYGALAGARNGMIFPEIWTKLVEGREELTYLAAGIYNLRKVA